MDLISEYIESLRRYLEKPGESGSGLASAIGRKAIAHGMSLKDMIAAQRQAFEELGLESLEKIRSAVEFFTESLSPFGELPAVLYDPITSLPNRTLFMDRLEQAVKRTTRRGPYTFAVL